MSPAKIKVVVDKLPRHICGQATYTDIWKLLEGNKNWSDEIDEYLTSFLDACVPRQAVMPRKKSCEVSLAALIQQFHQLVCMDHLLVANVMFFHFVDAASRFSAAAVVDSISLADSMVSFEACWIEQLWSLDSILFDGKFNKTELSSHLSAHKIDFKQISALRHKMKNTECKHNIIR